MSPWANLVADDCGQDVHHLVNAFKTGMKRFKHIVAGCDARPDELAAYGSARSRSCGVAVICNVALRQAG